MCKHIQCVNILMCIYIRVIPKYLDVLHHLVQALALFHSSRPLAALDLRQAASGAAATGIWMT